MLAVTDQFKAAVNAVTRNLDVVIRVKAASDADYANARIYSSQDLLLSLKIVDGQTTGGFGLGGTICPSLTAELHKTANVVVGDKIKAELVVYNGGGNLTMASEFTVDNIKRKSDGSLSVTALGDMITLAKNYISELTYPATQLDVLHEISEQTGFPLHPLITTELINNPEIQSAPTKGKAEDGTTLYYTRREMLGFAAAINGGAAYIDQYGRIDIARHNDTGETFTHEQVFNESITEPFTVEAVKWSSTGLSYSLGDDYNENTIEFYNPLIYDARELIAHNLETDLIGFSYDGATIKKQGCGYFEVGDIVHYVDIGGTTHDLLILGIVYEFNDGYFTETLHSLSGTPTQRNYTGSETVISPNVPEPSGGGSGDTIERAIIIQQKDISHLLHEYTIIKYFAGNKAVYAGPANQIIVGQRVFVSNTTFDKTAAPMYAGTVEFARGWYSNNVQTLTFKPQLTGYNINYTPPMKNVKFVMEGSVLSTPVSATTSTQGDYGFTFVYNSIVAPDGVADALKEAFPYGYVTANAYRVAAASTGYGSASMAAIYVGFADIEEFNCAVGLTYEPEYKDEVSETITVVPDSEITSGEEILQLAYAYTDNAVQNHESSVNAAIDSVYDSISRTNSSVSANAVQIELNTSAIEAINDPDSGILAQSMLYTDTKTSP